MYRLIEESSNTGRVLRVLAVGFTTHDEAERYAQEGLGADTFDRIGPSAWRLTADRTLRVSAQ